MNTACVTSTTKRSRVHGFTLLEVMIALVILAIGVMGVIGLQISTYKQLHTSHNFSKAAMLASDMADRMLANQGKVESSAYFHTTAPSEPEKNCTRSTCTPAELASYDIWHWQTELAGQDPEDGSKIPGSLPNPRGEVLQEDDDYIIVVRWDDDLSGSTGTRCTALDPAADQGADDLECYAINLGCLDALDASCP